MMEMAETSYRKVVELALHVYQARLHLSKLMYMLGRAEDALDTLQHDMSCQRYISQTLNQVNDNARLAAGYEFSSKAGFDRLMQEY